MHREERTEKKMRRENKTKKWSMSEELVIIDGGQLRRHCVCVCVRGE